MDTNTTAGGADRSLTLLHLRKKVSSFLKEAAPHETHLSNIDALLPLFSKIMSLYTPDELSTQFKELILFTQYICDILVTEIRRRANVENTREAAGAVSDFLQPTQPDSRGWVLLKSISFILNSGMQKVLEPICKTQLPSTLVKVFYLFFDLSPVVDEQDGGIRRKLYDLLVTLMNSMCSHTIVAQELIQKDDLIWLFVGASTQCTAENSIWRDANFAFLFSIIEKALSASVIKYIHSKGCVGHYLKNLHKPELRSHDKLVLLCNVLDLLRASATTTSTLIEDFKNANGYQTIVDFCTTEANTEQSQQIFHVLMGLITAGEETIHFSPMTTPLSFYNFKLPQNHSRSSSTVRIPDAYLSGTDELCLLVLENVLNLYNSELSNYFIVDKYYSLYLFVERMIVKSAKVQQKVLEIVEFVLRELNFVPCKELTALNTHTKQIVTSGDCTALKRILCFYFQILPVNISVKDAFRELLILETFLNIVQTCNSDLNSADKERSAVVQMAMDLLVTTTKGNVLNAQFVTENLEMKIIKSILLDHPSNDANDCAVLKQRREEFKSSALILIKNLLFLAKNEQLFSSLLQLLFSDPGNIPLCVIILKLFISVLLENHKVRIMFRRSGGCICLMTLLLHLEKSLYVPTLKFGHINEVTKDSIRTILQHISLIFRVLTVSMRYEPSNAKYFLTEVKPGIINSILRCIGCFTQSSQVCIQKRDIWDNVNMEHCKTKLLKFHSLFTQGECILERCTYSLFWRVLDTSSNFCDNDEFKDIPPQIFNALFILRLLFDLALDNYEKPSNTLSWANEKEWLHAVESVETIPVFSFSLRTVLVHPSAVICMLQLLPSINADPRETIKADEKLSDSTLLSLDLTVQSDLELWTASAQFYFALVLKALMRSERNQQIMCQHGMSKVLLDVGAELFRAERHPLLSPFYYLFERLACQSMHPRELRRFLRLDQPLCCLNLDDNDNNEVNKDVETVSGGPVPIHRVKALVSMLTPRNHSLVHQPAFVEFDLSIEGFACLFVPSISNVSLSSSSGGGTLNLSSTSERLFPPLNGFTFMTWFYVDDFHASVPQSSPSSSGNSHVNATICLLDIVRNFEGTEVRKKQDVPSLENHLTCFYVHLNMAERCLLVSTAEHSIVDELRRDFTRSPETFVRVPLSEQYFHTRQWTHLAIVLSRALLKQSQVEIYVNGRCLLNQKLAYVQANAGGAQAQVSENQPVHALVGTLPFLRRPSDLRWKMASLYLVEEPLSTDLIRKIIQLQPHYVGNLQTRVDGSILVSEDKLLLALNAKANAEITLNALRSMTRRTDCEMIASLLGISVNDNNTPLRLLWNTINHTNTHALCGVVIGYLGMRTFVSCPVSSLLDSIGGVAPLLGLIAMCTDSHELYASLKVLVSAVQTNNSIVNSLAQTRGYQTLAMLLEEKAHLINSHILHLILSLAGTVDVSKENTVIPNAQIFDDLLCDLDVWANASDDVKKLLFEHFYELVIDDHSENLSKVRSSSLLNRLLIFIFENRNAFPVRNDIVFRLIGAIVQPPCDSQSLLLLGQTISATVSSSSSSSFSFSQSSDNCETQVHESALPFHIAELERMLLNTARDVAPDELDASGELLPGIDLQIYAVYMRNRLLNIISTTLAHSSGPVNHGVCEAIVNTLGFGWVLSLCAPEIHSGTLYLALRILVNVTKYPALMLKFHDGTANCGWLSDADSVIRNRAANTDILQVLLGFSVAAHSGAVGSHVDVNPELSNCSGFAAMEHLMWAHADKPFVYLAILAIFFGQHNANIQPIEEFSVDIIWSHVFSLKENGSVAEALENVQFCPDILISLFSMTRACLQRQKFEKDQCHWSHNYPIMIVQLVTFLYQNSESFFVVCHTETFVISLFSTLISLQSPNSQSGQSISESGENRSVRQILELLTNILLNDLCLPHESRSEWPFDALVEFLDSGSSMCSYQSVLYTELVNACLDRFMSSNMFFVNASLMTPQSAQGQICQTSESTALNVIHFLSKVIDSVWNCLYRGNPISILKCFLKLLAEAHVANKAVAQITCTEVHLNALFRIVLYLISRPIDNIDTQMSVLDTLAEIVRNQHLLLSKNANNPLFYGALVHLIFMLSEKPDIQTLDENSHLERGTAQVSMCAQSVWGMLWQQKKALLDEIFKRDVDLDLYTARASCGQMANRCWLEFVDSQTDCFVSSSSGSGSSIFGANSASSLGNRLGNSAAVARVNVGQLQQNIQSKLSRVAKSSLQRLTSRRSVLGASFNSSGIVNSPAFQFERIKIEPETFHMWIRVHISLLKELKKNQCQRYHEWHAHVRKWCLKEWHNTEAELTRERGLWGPEKCSELDKYELDVTEGPRRIRKKLVPNPDFYQRYPYRPYLDHPEAKSLRAKVAISKDSKLYYERMRSKRFHTMDDRIIDTTTNVASIQHNDDQVLDMSTELNVSIIRRMMQKNLIASEIREQETTDAKVNAEKGAFQDEDLVDDEADLTESGVNSSVTDDLLPNDDSLKKIGESGGQKEKVLKETNQPQSPKATSYSRQTSQNKLTGNVGANASNNISGPDNQTLLRLLEEGEQLHSMFRCARIQGLDTLEGLLLFGKDHYYVVDGFTLLKTREIRDLDFLPEQFHDPIVPYMAMGSTNRPSTRSNRQCSKFNYEDIKEVHKRRYLLQPIALEVFSADGRNYLLAFPRKIRDRVFQKLVSMAKNSSSDVARTMAEQRKLLPAEASSTGHQLINQLMGQQSMTQKWQRGEISNFHYLMYLNTLAGRSYNDLSQYPVFPWIVADYESDKLDLTDSRTFRDLSKPMGAQSADRLSKFLKRYREWDDPTGDTPPYMFGTHYSSAMIVLSYLVRLEPFTEQFLKLQGGHFDLADRMFHSVRDAFISASCNNMADVRELIPEFFYLPELLLNSNNFDLSVKQSGVVLHHVKLPKWAHGDPYEFIRLHREALECDYVSEHLHEWIDLIFGYKQNGDMAREANNVFHHLFYEENVNFDVIEDPLTRNATLGFINNFGQIPSQLFKKPHPMKRVSRCANTVSNTSVGNSNLTNVFSFVPGVTTPKLFYHCLECLRPSTKPVKELKAAVGDIVINEKNQVIVLEQNKIFLPPSYYLAWGFNDHSIRFGAVGSDKPESVLEISDGYEITCMATIDGKNIFVGLTTGTVFVWSTMGSSSLSSSSTNSFSFSSTYGNITMRKALDAHTDVVTAIAACGAHNFVVSASRDHTAVLWHLTRFTFIRQLTGHPAAVTAVAVNDSTGDIATASNSFLFVWSLNGVLLAVINTAADSGLFSNSSSLILSISFSTLNEWDINNVVMCGTSDGLVKSADESAIRQVQSKSPHVDSVVDDHSSTDDSTKGVREHILKRQQRIQNHHYHRIMMNSSSTSSSVVGLRSVDQLSIDSSLTSSPINRTPHTSLQDSETCTSNSGTDVSKSENEEGNNTTSGDSISNSNVEENGPYSKGLRRVFTLRRVLSEHTAFNRAANSQPAPITSVQSTRDHKSVLVGDGVGRVWLWTMDQNQPAQNNSQLNHGLPSISNNPEYV